MHLATKFDMEGIQNFKSRSRDHVTVPTPPRQFIVLLASICHGPPTYQLWSV